MKSLTSTIIALLFTVCCFAQDLTGTWEGLVQGEYMKMVLLKQGNTYIGYTYDRDLGYCIANFLGNYTDSTRFLKGAGQGFIEHTLGHILLSFKLTAGERSDGLYLTGTARPKSNTMNVLSLGVLMRAELKQISKDVDTTEYMRNWLRSGMEVVAATNTRKVDSVSKSVTRIDTLNTVSTQQQVLLFNKKAFDDSLRTIKNARQSEVLRTIATKADSIVITISDNEIVDGDTVTIFHNNEVLVSRHFVSARPYRIVIPISKQAPRHEFVLVANNLGTIPPNTASLVIEAGKERYQLKAASDMNKNAVIIFEYRQ